MHYLANMTLYQKSDWVSGCAFTRRTIAPNVLQIRFEATEPLAFKDGHPQQQEENATSRREAAIWDQQFLIKNA